MEPFGEVQDEFDSERSKSYRIFSRESSINPENGFDDEDNRFEQMPSIVKIHIPSDAFDLNDLSNEETPDNIGLEMTYADFSSEKWNFNEMYAKSNSPIASNCNSDVENDDGQFRILKKYKKFTYEEIEQSLSKYYNKNDKIFNETDLLVTYLKGYKMIYSQSKNITQMKLYLLFTITLGITMCLSIIAPFIKDSPWGAYLISSGNAAATVLIAFARYLKFETHSFQYSSMANQYDKLETMVEFESSNTDHLSTSRLSELEKKMAEMKETSDMCFVPEEVIRLFPLIYNTNIFRFIHKIEQYKTNLIIKFCDIKNEIHYIMHRWNSVGDKIDDVIDAKRSPRKVREKNRLLHLMGLKEKTKMDLLHIKSTYNQIDELFNKEIRYAETHQSCFGCGGWLRPEYDFSKLTPVVREYLKLVIPD